MDIEHASAAIVACCLMAGCGGGTTTTINYPEPDAGTDGAGLGAGNLGTDGVSGSPDAASSSDGASGSDGAFSPDGGGTPAEDWCGLGSVVCDQAGGGGTCEANSTCNGNGQCNCSPGFALEACDGTPCNSDLSNCPTPYVKCVPPDGGTTNTLLAACNNICNLVAPLNCTGDPQTFAACVELCTDTTSLQSCKAHVAGCTQASSLQDCSAQYVAFQSCLAGTASSEWACMTWGEITYNAGGSITINFSSRSGYGGTACAAQSDAMYACAAPADSGAPGGDAGGGGVDAGVFADSASADGAVVDGGASSNDAGRSTSAGDGSSGSGGTDAADDATATASDGAPTGEPDATDDATDVLVDSGTTGGTSPRDAAPGSVDAGVVDAAAASDGGVTTSGGLDAARPGDGGTTGGSLPDAETGGSFRVADADTANDGVAE